MRPRVTAISIALACAAIATGRPSLGQAEYRDVDTQLMHKYRDANNYFEKAKIQFAKKDFAGAQKELATCIEIMPDYSDAHLMLAKIHYSQKDLGKALSEVVQAKASFEATAGLMQRMQQYRLDALRRRLDPIDQALVTLRARLASAPPDGQAAIQAQISQAERDKANIDRALIEPVPNLNQVPAEYFFFHGNVLLRMQKAAEAAAQYDEALRINPAYGEAANNLASLLYSTRQYQKALEVVTRVEGKGGVVNQELKKAIQDALK